MVRWVCLIGRGRPHPLTVLHEAVIDLFTFSDRWNVNQMQATFTMGCGQATPTGGKETHRPCTHWAETLRYTLIPVDKNIAMPKNCCVVKCSNWMGKKEGLRFPRFPANHDKERCRGGQLQPGAKTGNQEKAPEYATHIPSPARHHIGRTLPVNRSPQ
jgi:hypothetical protein